MLALQPELVVLGTGATQVFPPAAVMAACLTRGIGIEVMTNAAAARTYSVLAGEGRRVVGGVRAAAGRLPSHPRMVCRSGSSRERPHPPKSSSEARG